MILNIEQKTLLKKIVEDKYAIGPFSGMIFNAKMQAPNVDTAEIIKTALNVRLKIKEMSE